MGNTDERSIPIMKRQFDVDEKKLKPLYSTGFNMTNIYFHTNYPDLTSALDSLHSLQANKQFSIERTQTLSGNDTNHSVITI